MLDPALDKYIATIEKEYDQLMTEDEVCNLLNYTKIHFCRLRKAGVLIPFIKIGNRINYIKDDVIDFIKKNRKR
ncbi:MAG: helix-turn-helix domain-containing protein [Thermoplasmatales archaeon]